jgi:hypothetical protein
VLDNWQPMTTGRAAFDRAYFTPPGLAGDMKIEVSGSRIIDIGAGIGRLPFHMRDAWSRWPHGEREFVCIERNEEHVRVGRKVMPNAEWICADMLEIPQMLDRLGEFDCAISNPPFGVVPRAGHAPGGYRGRRTEYHAIALAALVAMYGVFLIPQRLAPFQLSGVAEFRSGCEDSEYVRFSEATGIRLRPSCGIDTSIYADQWNGAVRVAMEVACGDFRDCKLPGAPGAWPVNA